MDKIHEPCSVCGCLERNNKGACMECTKRTRAEWYQRNKLKVRSEHAKYYLDNRERIIANVREYEKANAEKIMQRGKEYRAKNKDRIANSNASYYAKNKERINARDKEYRTANKEKLSKRRSELYILNREAIRENAKPPTEESRASAVIRAKEWAKNNPEKARLHGINKAAKRRSLIGGDVLPDGTIEMKFELQKGKCACCGKQLGMKYHVDHIIPIILGGKNVPDNIQLLLPSCNSIKSGKHPIDYMQSKGFLL